MGFRCKFTLSVDIRPDVTAAQVAAALTPLAQALDWPSPAVITGYLLGNPAVTELVDQHNSLAVDAFIVEPGKGESQLSRIAIEYSGEVGYDFGPVTLTQQAKLFEQISDSPGRIRLLDISEGSNRMELQEFWFGPDPELIEQAKIASRQEEVVAESVALLSKGGFQTDSVHLSAWLQACSLDRLEVSQAIDQADFYLQKAGLTSYSGIVSNLAELDALFYFDSEGGDSELEGLKRAVRRAIYGARPDLGDLDYEQECNLGRPRIRDS